MILECGFIYVWESLCYVNGRTCSSNGMCKKYFNLLFSGFKWTYSWFTILWISGEDLCFKKMTNSKSHSRWKNWRVLGLEKVFLSQMGYAFMVEPNEQKKDTLIICFILPSGTQGQSSTFSLQPLLWSFPLSSCSHNWPLCLPLTRRLLSCLIIHTMEPGDRFHLLLILLAVARSFSLSSSWKPWVWISIRL